MKEMKFKIIFIIIYICIVGFFTCFLLDTAGTMTTYMKIGMGFAEVLVITMGSLIFL